MCQIMEKRIQMASTKGCDGIDPDNIGMWLPPKLVSANTDYKQMRMVTRVVEAGASHLSSRNRIPSTISRSSPMRLIATAWQLV